MFLLDQQELVMQIRLYIQLAIYAILPLLLIFLITLGALKNNSNYIFKSFVIGIVGSVITVLFLCATLLDYLIDTVHYVGIFAYLIFDISSFILTLSFSLILYLKGKKRYQHLSFKRTKPSIDRNVIRYSYVVFHSNGKVLLQRNNDLYKAIEYKHDKNHIFEDDALSEVAKSFNLNVSYSDFKLIGKYIIKDKKTKIYSCYFIECDLDENSLNSKYELVSDLELMKYAMEDRDRKMILRTIIRQEFEIEE